MRKGRRKLCIMLALLLGCMAASAVSVCPVPASQSGTFSGTWDATGSKESLAFGNGREVALFKLSGHVRLHDKIGNERDFWAESIGLADSETGSDIRCVWRSMQGDEIYLILKGTRMEKGSSISGNIIGGTGAAKGITGTLRFTWTMVFKGGEETEIGGFSNDLSGTYNLP